MTELVLDISNQNLVRRFVEYLLKDFDVNPKYIEIASTKLKGSHGMCIDLTEDEYLILVDETDRNIGDIFVTIAHEMVHVKQFVKENLGWFIDNRSDIPYYQRWWEKEAFEKSVSYVEKFAKGLKNVHD